MLEQNRTHVAPPPESPLSAHQSVSTSAHARGSPAAPLYLGYHDQESAAHESVPSPRARRALLTSGQEACLNTASAEDRTGDSASVSPRNRRVNVEQQRADPSAHAGRVAHDAELTHGEPVVTRRTAGGGVSSSEAGLVELLQARIAELQGALAQAAASQYAYTQVCVCMYMCMR
jgi:hypothetical protein